MKENYLFQLSIEMAMETGQGRTMEPATGQQIFNEIIALGLSAYIIGLGVGMAVKVFKQLFYFR